MGKFIAAPDLEERVAARWVIPYTNDVIEKVADTARALAPPTKTWQTMEDALVRSTHKRANKQEVPGNLRHTVKSMEWDMQHRGVGEFTYMRAPGDESSGAYVNLIHCRCEDVVDPGGISRLIKTDGAAFGGGRVIGRVTVEGNLIHQAEYGDVYPGGLVADGTFFMHRAASLSAGRLRVF